LYCLATRVGVDVQGDKEGSADERYRFDEFVASCFCGFLRFVDHDFR